MLDLKACIACFSTDAKLYNMDSGPLRHEYNLVSGLKTEECSGMPKYLCFECSAYVKHFVKFRGKCQRAHFALRGILQRNQEINASELEAIDRKCLDIMPMLSFIDTDHTKYEEVMSEWENTKYSALYNTGKIPIIHHSTYATQVIDLPKEPELTTVIQDSIKLEHDDMVKEEVLPPSTEQLDFEMLIFKDEDSDYLDNDDSNRENHSEDMLPVNSPEIKTAVIKIETDGPSLDEEYGSMVAISNQEAQAVVDVYRFFGHGTFRCQVCNKGYHTEEILSEHLLLHDQHVSGNFHCTLCNSYYKTESLLMAHTTENHMYKYECKECNEVSFDRISAKKHYNLHLQHEHSDEYESQWLKSEGSELITIRPKTARLQPDFLVCSAIKHEEQYDLLLKRKKSQNYLASKFKCELCYRGFKFDSSYNKHMRKHDPEYSGAYQCDVCKLYFRSTFKLFRHIRVNHLLKYSCRHCKFVCFNKPQAHLHYLWHKNVTYQCPYCKQEFRKAVTRYAHIGVKHPSTCNVCGHRFVSENSLRRHKRLVHGVEGSCISMETSEELEVPDTMDNDNTSTRKNWTKEEEEYLIRLVKFYKKDEYIPWGKVASCMKNRTKIQIYNKYFRLVEKRKGRFLPEEDAVILTCLDKFGLSFKKMAEYLPGRSAIQIRVRYGVLAKNRISTSWTVQEDNKLLQLMSNEDSITSYSRVTDHFPGKTRIQIRGRYLTLVNWMQRHPGQPIDNAPRRGARRLTHGLASENLYKATEKLKKRIACENERKNTETITRASPLVVIEDAIITKLQNERVEEEEISKTEAYDEDILVPNDEIVNSAHSLSVTNLQKLIVFLRGKLNRDRFKESSFAGQYPGLLDSQQEVNRIQVKSYSRKQKTVPVVMNSPDIWGSNTLNSLTYVLPPHYATITGCAKLMRIGKMKVRRNAYTEPFPNISAMIKKNPILKEQMFILMERFNALFLYPTLLSHEGPGRVGRYVMEPKTINNIDVQEKLKIGPDYGTLSLGIPAGTMKLCEPSNEGQSIDLEEPSAHQKALTCLRKVVVDVNAFTFVADKEKKSKLIHFSK